MIQYDTAQHIKIWQSMVYTQYGAVKTVIKAYSEQCNITVQHNLVQYGTAYRSTAGV